MPLIARRVRSPLAYLGTGGEPIVTNVLTVQCGLWRLGFDPGRFDSLWGPVTHNALNRWFLWYESRVGGPLPDPTVVTPRANRSGQVTLPAGWDEIVESAARGTCRLEARGSHRAPPVPEPQPLAPPPVIVDPETGTEQPAPRIEVQQAGLDGGGMALGLLVLLGLGATAYYAGRQNEADVRNLGPVPPPRY